jgi:hypothetical protein
MQPSYGLRSYVKDLFGEPTMWISLIVICLALMVTGCAHQVTAALPAGALNTFDADSFRVLSDAHATVQSIHDDAAAGKVTLTASQKTLINHVISDDALANHLYQAYHANGAGDTTALSQAIQALIADLASLATAVPTQAAASPAK